jgi:hypothetical protein
MSDAQKEHLARARETLREKRRERSEDNSQSKTKKIKVVQENDTASSFSLPVPQSNGNGSSLPSGAIIAGGIVGLGAILVGGGYYAKNKFSGTKLKVPKNNAPNPAATEASAEPTHIWPKGR